MEFKITKWAYSNDVDTNEYYLPPEGTRLLFIHDAEFSEDEGKYVITFRDIEDGLSFRVNYWMNKNDSTGNPVPNQSVRNSLVGLGKALAGVSIGSPYPADIIGGVVYGDVTHYTSSQGKTYPRIYRFTPVPEPLVLAYGQIPQYCLTDEDDTAGEDECVLS